MPTVHVRPVLTVQVVDGPEPEGLDLEAAAEAARSGVCPVTTYVELRAKARVVADEAEAHAAAARTVLSANAKPEGPEGPFDQRKLGADLAAESEAQQARDAVEWEKTKVEDRLAQRAIERQEIADACEVVRHNIDMYEQERFDAMARAMAEGGTDVEIETVERQLAELQKRLGPLKAARTQRVAQEEHAAALSLAIQAAEGDERSHLARAEALAAADREDQSVIDRLGAQLTRTPAPDIATAQGVCDHAAAWTAWREAQDRADETKDAAGLARVTYLDTTGLMRTALEAAHAWAGETGMIPLRAATSMTPDVNELLHSLIETDECTYLLVDDPNEVACPAEAPESQ